MKIAYVMSRFPKVTETFILYEMLAMEAMGVEVEIFPLLRHRTGPRHPEADRLVRRARFSPFLSLPVLAANWAFFRRSPLGYLRVWRDVLTATFGSANFFFGALGILPKSVLFAREMERLGVDHVHAHFASHPAVTAFVVGRLTGIPFSFTAHGSDLHVERRMLERKVREAALVVTVSDYNRELIVAECGKEVRDDMREEFREGVREKGRDDVREEVREEGRAYVRDKVREEMREEMRAKARDEVREEVRAKVRVIHCGVDTRFFSPSEEERDPATTLVFHMVCVASLEEVKGHRFLVDACRLLRGRGVAFQCDLVGDGPRRSEIRAAIASAGLEKRVRLRGALPRPEVISLLRCADAAVLASHPTPSGKREGIPVALMEAMASELPVVASAVSGIPELVDDGRCGFLVPSGDPTILADALERLATDPDLRTRMGRAGRRKVLEAFDLERNARRLLEEIRGVGRGFSGGSAEVTMARRAR